MGERRALIVTLVVTLLLVVLTVGCGGAGKGSGNNASGGDKRGLSSGTEAERFFPLIDGHIYQYVTRNEEGTEGMMVARVARIDAQRGQLRFSNETKSFEFAPDGVKTTSKAGHLVYLLKTPLQVGTSWPGQHRGVVKIMTVDVAVDVPAGHFDGCLQTVEQRGGDVPVRYAATFCPEVGLVLLEAASKTQTEQAELKSYGPPVSIGEDGVRLLK